MIKNRIEEELSTARTLVEHAFVAIQRANKMIYERRGTKNVEGIIDKLREVTEGLLRRNRELQFIVLDTEGMLHRDEGLDRMKAEIEKAHVIISNIVDSKKLSKKKEDRQ